MVNIYADGIPPDLEYINKTISAYKVCGATCNPTLVKNYLPMSYYDYCKTIIDGFAGLPVSIQVLTSDLVGMIEQARVINSWGKNIYVKIPVINEYGESCRNVIIQLMKENIQVNITAVLEPNKLIDTLKHIPHNTNYILSVFAGRISDTGKYPNNTMQEAAQIIKDSKTQGKLLWAGARQLLDVISAENYCDIITLPKSILDKLPCLKKNLADFCLETVQMFARDSENFTL